MENTIKGKQKIGLMAETINIYGSKTEENSTHKGTGLWKKPLFKYLILPLVVTVLGGFILYLLTNRFDKQQKLTPNDDQNPTIRPTTTPFITDSVFDVAENIWSQGTTLAKEEALKRYLNLQARDEGYIIEVKPVAQTESVGLFYDPLGDYKEGVKKYFLVDIAATTAVNKKPMIRCAFSQEWEQVLKTVNPPKYVQFRGTIAATSFFLYTGPQTLDLRECALENQEYRIY